MNKTRALSTVFTLVLLAGAALAFRYGGARLHFSSNSLLGQIASVLDGVTGSSESKPVMKTFSTIGVVSSLATEDSQSTVILSGVQGAHNEGETTYKFERSDINKIESSTYSPLDLSGIKVGDTIIIQGSRDESGALTPRRIILLVSATSTTASVIETVAASTTIDTPVASTTIDTPVASTSEETASSSETSTTSETEAPTEASSTEPIVTTPSQSEAPPAQPSAEGQPINESTQ